MSLVTLKDKVEQLIKKAQNAKFVGVKWLETDNNGYPVKVEICGAPTLETICYNGSTHSNYQLLKEVILNSTYTSMGGSSFAKCTRLEKITDISNATSFADACFDGCSSLVIGALPKNLTYIGQYAMRGCIKNQFSTIPATVETIGGAAFNGGWKGNDIIFKGTPKTIANNAFMNNSNITNIYCPWAEGAVANAPWGATNATIHYNYTAEV